MDADEARADESPERFDPASSGGMLIDAEHRARYWSAAGLVAARRVLDAGCGTGYGTQILAEGGAASLAAFDVADEAVERARSSTNGRVEVLRADIHELPYDDASFDVVVCFEVLEHVHQQDAALAELARVLAPGGLLVVSSPNRDVYVAGNPHHVREYTPDELHAALTRLFPSVALYRQHAWLASGLLADATAASPAGEPTGLPVHLITPLAPGGETYTVAVAAKGDAPVLPERVVLAEAYEVGRWAEQMQRFQEREDDLRRQIDGLVAERASFQRGVDAALAARDATIAEARELLDDRDARIADRDARLESSSEILRQMQASSSWRLTRPLRTLKRLGGRR